MRLLNTIIMHQLIQLIGYQESHYNNLLIREIVINLQQFFLIPKVPLAMSQRWRTPKKFPHTNPFSNISTASRYHASSSKKQQPITLSPQTPSYSSPSLSSRNVKTISQISNDNILLLQLLTANSKYNNKNHHYQNKFKLGLILKQLSLLKDLLSQHHLLCKFWEIVKDHSVLFSFLVIEIILKEKRVYQHAERMFGEGSREVRTLRGMQGQGLRKEFWSFVTNRVTRKGMGTEGEKKGKYEMKIINPPRKTIRIQLDKEEQVMGVIEDFDEGKLKGVMESVRSKGEFRKLVWDAWDDRI